MGVIELMLAYFLFHVAMGETLGAPDYSPRAEPAVKVEILHENPAQDSKVDSKS
jgi:hypothetical protein